MYETEITKYGDIFEGSTLIEKLTEETAARARELAMQLRAAGYRRALEIVGTELTRLLMERQFRIESGQILQVGVNAFQGEIGLSGAPATTDNDSAQRSAEQERISTLARWRQRRDSSAVARAREMLERAAAEGGPMMEGTIALARAGGTVGEWTESLERVSQGRYTPQILDARAAVSGSAVRANGKRLKVALGKAGLDGHINAVKLLARACMEAGMEVVLAGFKQTSAQMVETALQEDVDVLAISSLAGAHLTIARDTLALLEERGAADVRVVMGGIIPEVDQKRLLAMGVRAVFTPKDSNLSAIVTQIAALGPRDHI
jgi:(2R)-ethylmalonyl-CoA mutase